MVDLKKIKAGVNRVIVKLIDMNDKINFNGTKLFISTKYNAQDHVPVWGEVVGLPTKLYFNKKSPYSMEWETDMELSLGDTVYIDYLATLRALSTEFNPADAYPEPSWIKQDGFYYVILKYQDIYLRVRNKKVQPINGYCIAKPIRVKEKEYKGIIVPFSNKTSNKWAEIIYVGNPCKDFLGGEKDKGEIHKGDVVLFRSYSNRKVENSLHRTLFEDDYFVIQRKYMLLNAGKSKQLVEKGVLN